MMVPDVDTCLVPDLAFSEMKFLDGRSFDLPIAQKASPNYKKDKKSRGRKEENEPFSYFESSKRRLEEKKLNTVTISISDGYTEPRKRRRKNEKSTPEKPSTEVLMTESPIKSSPRSAMADVLRRRGIYSLPANISSRDSNCGSAITSGRDRGRESSDEGIPENKDIDGLSEYSRARFQKRFRPEMRVAAHLQERGTSSPTLETLKYAKEAYHARYREGGSSYASSAVVKDNKSEAEGVDRARTRTPEMAITKSKSPTPKSRRTLDPAELQKVSLLPVTVRRKITIFLKVPGSSSPLAALLRVCADSPERLGVRKRHDSSHDDKVGRKGHQSSKIPQRPVFYPQKSVPSQPSVVYQDRPSRPPRPLGVPPTRQLTKMEGLMDNYTIPPHALYAKVDRHPLDETQQSGESQNFSIRGQAMAENYVNEKHLDDYADDYPESPVSETIENQCLSDLSLYGYTKDRNGRKVFVEDSFMDSSSDYAPDGWVTDDPDICRLNGSSEERQTHEVGHPYTAKTVLGQGRGLTMNEGQCYVEGIRHSNGGYVEQVLEDPAPKRENFWRKHKL